MPPTRPPLPALDRSALLAALRARMARMDRSGRNAPLAAGHAGDSVPLCAAIDQSLPGGGGGLARAALHEVLAAEPGAAAGFCALVLARAARPGDAAEVRGSLLWIAVGVVPPAVMLMVWHGAPPQTVAEILYTAERRE